MNCIQRLWLFNFQRNDKSWHWISWLTFTLNSNHFWSRVFFLRASLFLSKFPHFFSFPFLLNKIESIEIDLELTEIMSIFCMKKKKITPSTIKCNSSSEVLKQSLCWFSKDCFKYGICRFRPIERTVNQWIPNEMP